MPLLFFCYENMTSHLFGTCTSQKAAGTAAYHTPRHGVITADYALKLLFFSVIGLRLRLTGIPDAVLTRCLVTLTVKGHVKSLT